MSFGPGARNRTHFDGNDACCCHRCSLDTCCNCATLVTPDGRCTRCEPEDRQQADAVDLSKVLLRAGSHRTRAMGVCVLEALAWTYREPHTMNPSQVCPSIAPYVRMFNDAAWSSDEARTAALMVWVAFLGEDRTTEAVQQARARWLAERVMSFWTPLAGMVAIEHMETLGQDTSAIRATYLRMIEQPSMTTAVAVELTWNTGATLPKVIAYARNTAENAGRAWVAATTSPSASTCVAALAVIYTADALCVAAGSDRMVGTDRYEAALRLAVSDLEFLLSITSDGDVVTYGSPHHNRSY